MTKQWRSKKLTDGSFTIMVTKGNEAYAKGLGAGHPE